MKPDLKEKLLLRKFVSIEYIESFVNHYVSAIDAAENGVADYKSNPPQDPQLLAKYKHEMQQWETKVLPNFRRMKKNAIDGLDAAQNGDYDIIEGATGSFRGLSKDMDGIGEEWWQIIDQNIRDEFFLNIEIARKLGANIYYTLAKYWDPGEIIDEEITGPINEQDLLKYLKPGETV